MFETITEHLTNTLTDDALKGIMTKQYGENLFNMVTIFKKMGPGAVVEACMRAETGMPIMITAMSYGASLSLEAKYSSGKGSKSFNRSI